MECIWVNLKNVNLPLSNISVFRKLFQETTRADWLKIVFLQLDGDTELTRAFDVMMARAKRIYFLIINVNPQHFSFSQTSARVSITR